MQPKFSKKITKEFYSNIESQEFIIAKKKNSFVGISKNLQENITSISPWGEFFKFLTQDETHVYLKKISPQVEISTWGKFDPLYV